LPRKTRREAKTEENSSARRNLQALPKLKSTRSMRPPPVSASDGQTGAALGATSADHGAAAAGAHAHEEAVGALTANDRRLVGAFHGGIPRKEKRAITAFKPLFVKQYFLPCLWITFRKPARMAAADDRWKAAKAADVIGIL
jgi:hypothetical protein